ncbi:MAG: hypothetical protein Q9162_004625 [Coniocarpon cinnabarinum]
MSYRVPDSASPPSTPNKSRNPALDDHPSTTPAGPPPTSLTGLSTTPTGNPPASSFLGHGSNGSAVPFPTFLSSSRKPSNNSFSRSRQDPILDDDAHDDASDAMDQDEEPGQDLMQYSQASRDESLPITDSLNLLEIAKGLTTSASPSFKEPDSMILQTEEILDELAQATGQDSYEETQSLGESTQLLLEAWRQSITQELASVVFGPSLSLTPQLKALLVASLLLQIHNPPANSRFTGRAGSLRQHPDPIPKVLLDWLNRFHWPFKGDFEEVFDFQPNPACHDRFWDIVYNSTVRGDIRSACDLLRNADLAQAVTAIHDGDTDFGYEGKQLANANRAVSRAIEVLESCPGAQSNDWNVKGPEWTLFRRRVQQARNDLQSFAEGGNVDRYSRSNSNFEASHFGMDSPSNGSLSFSQRSRQAESRVPWSIYQNLVYLYGQLLGTPSEIIAASSDWLEGTLGLTAWWDGDDADLGQRDMASSRHLRRSFQRQDRLIDAHPQAAYLAKLSETLLMVKSSDDDYELQVDPTNATQVALACVVTSEFEGLIRLVKGWSPVIASAIVEIGGRGGWLGRARPSDGMMEGFNQSDLMVLSYAQQRGLQSDHDTMLCDYASLLFSHATFQDHSTQRQGWHLAIEVLGRLHDESMAERKISELLDQMDLRDAAEVDETIRLCNNIGLLVQSRRISERYGDKLAETTHLYGTAIFYYTRAGASGKIKDILDLLSSLSLVQSMAYPPADEMDESLLFLIQSPKQTMSRLAVLDPETSVSLIRHVSGYATVRKFYELRDQEYLEQHSTATSLRPLARKKEALANLINLVQSASDSIHGGLFDHSVDTALPTDCLPVLLGEAMPFVNHPRSLMNRDQIVALLKAVEDLSTVSPTIYEQCDECFKSAIASAHGSTPPSPRTTLKRSGSNLSGSQFSLIGSDLLKQSQTKSSASNSGVLVKGSVKRAWDWRQGFDRHAESVDVLKILRLGLAKEISRTWLMDE